MMTEDENPAVTRFREYLRIKTVHPDPDYASAVEFLKKQAIDIGLQCMVMEVHTGRPVVIMTWEGHNPQLPSVMLNSHIDVVPVFPDYWQYGPFEAIKAPDGKIYGRGSQDMKSVGMQYLEVIRILKFSGQKLLRTIHVTFVPDEEIGGTLGMSLFLKTEVFKRMNVGFVLDEGYASPNNTFYVFYGDRICWWLKITCKGNPGHGSRFIENTAPEKMRKIINSFLDFREREKRRLEVNEDLTLGDVTTVNLNMLNGGIQVNVIPSEMTAVFDIRISPTINLPEFERMVLSWINEAGDDISYEFLQKSPPANVTSINPDNPWWRAFSNACIKMDVDVKCEIFPAATDSHYLRQLGYPALGFSPINNTPILLHDHDEYLEEKVYLQGINIYLNLIPALANVPQTGSIPSVPRVNLLQSLSSVSNGQPITPNDYISPLITMPSKGNVYPPSNMPSMGNVPSPTMTDYAMNATYPTVNVPSYGQIPPISNIQSRGTIPPRPNILPTSNMPSPTNLRSVSQTYSQVQPTPSAALPTTGMPSLNQFPSNMPLPPNMYQPPANMLPPTTIPSMGDTFMQSLIPETPLMTGMEKLSTSKLIETALNPSLQSIRPNPPASDKPKDLEK